MDWGRTFRARATRPQQAVQSFESTPESHPFSIHVVFTTWRGTRAAMRVAGLQSRSLGARIVLWYFQVVPSQFNLASPPVSTEFVARRLAAIAQEYCAESEAEVHICFCTDQRHSMTRALAAESLVITGGKRRWWRSREERIATLLQSHGCRVLFVSDRDAAPVSAKPTR